MFEITPLCYAISAVLGLSVLADAGLRRRRGRPDVFRIGPLAWTALVAVTWVAVLPYAIGRFRTIEVRTHAPV